MPGRCVTLARVRDVQSDMHVHVYVCMYDRAYAGCWDQVEMYTASAQHNTTSKEASTSTAAQRQ